MSAVHTEILDDGAKNARIFKVCNYLIYSVFILKGAKSPLFSMFLPLNVGLSAKSKPPSCFYR